MAAADTVLRIAEAENGYHEQGINHTKYGRAYGWDGVFWCAIFIWWVFWKAGLLALLPEKTASAPGLAEAFRRAGRFGHTPRKGAVVFFDLNFNGGIDHVGIVIARLADGRIKTVEGNTADGVHIRYRSPSLIAGYGYPDYAQEDDMQPKDMLDAEVELNPWIPKAWPKDKGLQDGKLHFYITAGSTYAHSRKSHENTDKLVAVAEQLAAKVEQLAADVAELKARVG